MTETHEISLMIHGTFARDEQWWKPGDGQSAADLLEKELAKRGHGGTVWLPAIESGMASDEFAWSGANTHAARIDGARQLADALRRLADRQSCTAVEPLAVNLVAHSHGGNVVLEALDMLPANVAIRRFVMLGTPMVWRRPSSRVYRIFNALTLPLFLLWLVRLALAPYAVEDPDPDLPSLWSTLLVIAILLSLYPWYLHWYTRLTAWVVRLFNSVFRPARLRGTAGYGPDPAALAEMVGGPVYHIGSREDEADLLLHFGASPFEVYQAFLKGRLRGILKWIERILVRPWFYVVVEPVVETALEHYALGTGSGIRTLRCSESMSATRSCPRWRQSCVPVLQ